ncbi:hypothetical protein ACDI53_21215, partial [Klebsiella pneumoniae]
HGDVLMWLMKTLLTSGCTNQRGAGHEKIKMPQIRKDVKRLLHFLDEDYFTSHITRTLYRANSKRREDV